MLTNDWLTTTPILIALVLALFKAIDYSVTWGRLQQRTYVQTEFELLKIDRKEPQRTPGRVFFNVVILIFSLLVFVYDGFFVKAIIESRDSIEWNSSWILVFLMFFIIAVVLPILLSWDTLKGMLKKQTKIEWSTTLQINGEPSSVFRHCQIVLLNMGANIISLDRDSGEILARLRRYKISVKVEATDNDASSSILVESYTAIPTIMPDPGGGDRKNIEEFVKGFYKLEH